MALNVLDVDAHIDDMIANLKALPLRPESPFNLSPVDEPDSSSSSLDQQVPMTKRQHALHELLSSERAYASDLALIRAIHIPLALGNFGYFFLSFWSPFLISYLRPTATFFLTIIITLVVFILFTDPLRLIRILLCLNRGTYDPG